MPTRTRAHRGPEAHPVNRSRLQTCAPDLVERLRVTPTSELHGSLFPPLAWLLHRQTLLNHRSP